jgi:uncharacterized protein
MKWLPQELRRYWRELLLMLLFLLPAAALPLFGLIWLWQQGLLYLWLAILVGSGALPLLVRLFWRPGGQEVPLPPVPQGAAQAELRAREQLEQLMAAVSAEDVESPEAIQRLLVGVFDAVALAYAPEDDLARLNFTIPEMLLMSEEMAQRLRQVLLTEFPVLRRVSVSRAIKGYHVFNPVMQRGRRLYVVWRLLRAFNPVHALVAEARGLVFDQMLDTLGSRAKAIAAGLMVREAGEAAILLYSGGYRLRLEEFQANAPPPRPSVVPGPLTLLIAGQLNAGKSSLLNALLGSPQVPTGLATPRSGFVPFELHHPQAGSLVLVDSPGVGSEPSRQWIEQARAADLVIWVAAANRADRGADQRALRRLRELCQQDPRLRAVPVVAALAFADRLDPPLEWCPPYDPLSGQRPKERSMRAALEAAAAALALPPQRCALVAVEYPERAWNLEGLWRVIHEALPEARQKQLEHGLEAANWSGRLVDGMESIGGLIRSGWTLLRGTGKEPG